jgi:hypothetical protein
MKLRAQSDQGPISAEPNLPNSPFGELPTPNLPSSPHPVPIRRTFLFGVSRPGPDQCGAAAQVCFVPTRRRLSSLPCCGLAAAHGCSCSSDSESSRAQGQTGTGFISRNPERQDSTISSTPGSQRGLDSRLVRTRIQNGGGGDGRWLPVEWIDDSSSSAGRQGSQSVAVEHFEQSSNQAHSSLPHVRSAFPSPHPARSKSS